MNNLVKAPEPVHGDVNFQAFINCKLTLKDGTHTVLWAFAPKGVSFEDVAMGLNKAFEASGIVHSVEKEVYTLRKGKTASLFCHLNKLIFK